jgi:hypothetical protein
MFYNLQAVQFVVKPPTSPYNPSQPPHPTPAPPARAPAHFKNKFNLHNGSHAIDSKIPYPVVKHTPGPLP